MLASSAAWPTTSRATTWPGILGSVEVFARRQPALFVGAAVALGFALTRVVRSGDDPSGVIPAAIAQDTVD